MARTSRNLIKLREMPGPASNLQSRSSRILLRSITSLVGLVVGLLLAEIGLRALHLRPERYPPQQWLAWDGTAFRDTAIWGGGLMKRPSPYGSEGVTMGEYVPGARFKVVFPNNPRGYFDRDNSVPASINSLGLRGEEVTAEKPPGTFRILGLGDSFTFGEGVRNEDTFLHRLQLRLDGGDQRSEISGQRSGIADQSLSLQHSNTPSLQNSSNPIIHQSTHPTLQPSAAPAAPARFQVLNAGVQGYNTRDEVVYLEKRWLALQPDLVLIIFYINDAYDDGVILNRGQELGIYNAKPAGLAKYSYLWDLAQYKYNAYASSKKLEAYYKQHFFTEARAFLENPGDFKVDWTVCRAALERAVQITRGAAKKEIRLGLIMFPELSNLKRDYPFVEVHKLVRETCGRLGIPFLDLLDTFRGHEPKSLWVHPSNHHPNEHAHALAAESIERFLRDEFLEPRKNTEEHGFPRDPVIQQSNNPTTQSSTTPPLHNSNSPTLQRLQPPDLPQAHNELANALVREGKVDEAIIQIEKALAIQPNDSQAHNNLGNLLHKKGRLDEAIAHYQKALELQPGSGMTHHNLGNVLLEQHRLADAATHFRKAIELQPDFAAAHNNLGQVFLEAGQTDDALTEFRRALELRPELATAHHHLGLILLQKEQNLEGVAHLQKAVELRPESPRNCNSLAWVLATHPKPSYRDGARAVQLAQRAEQLSGGNTPEVLRTLAAAYAEAGKFSEAVAVARRALSVATAQNNLALAQRLEKENALYQAHSPCRDTAQGRN